MEKDDSTSRLESNSCNEVTFNVVEHANVEQQRLKETRTFIDRNDLENIEECVVIPPDGGWGWLVVAAAFTSFLVTEGIVYSFGVFLKNIADDLGCTRSQVSIIGAVKSSSVCFSGK